MEKSYLAKEARRKQGELISQLVKVGIAAFIAAAVLYVLTRREEEAAQFTQKLLPALLAVIVTSVVVRLVKAGQKLLNYGNLSVHAKEIGKESAGRVIDDEAEQGKILVEEYMEKPSGGRRPTGDKIVLLPSYLLLCEKTVTAIPVERIFWVCAQVGYKGGPYIVRLQVFAENKLYNVVGADIAQVKNIVDALYQYIPNIFSQRDSFELSYQLEELFSKDYNQFCEICRQLKQVHMEQQRLS